MALSEPKEYNLSKSYTLSTDAFTMKKHAHFKIFFLIMISLALHGCFSSKPQLPKLKPGDVIVAFGDSLTYGTGAPKNSSYPAILQRQIGYKVINAGIPGETTEDSLKHLPSVLKKYHPKIVLLCIGGNDILRRYPYHRITNNIKKLIGIIELNGATTVLISVPGLNLFASPPDFYEDIGDEYHIPVIKHLLSKLLRNAEYKSDPIHLNAKGYNAFATGISNFLKERGAL